MKTESIKSVQYLFQKSVRKLDSLIFFFLSLSLAFVDKKHSLVPEEPDTVFPSGVVGDKIK